MAALAGASAVDNLSKWFHPTPWRSTWMGPSYFLKSQNCLWLLDLLLRSELPSIPKLWRNFADSVVFGVVERPLCSDFADFVFFNNGPERKPQSCAPTVENDRRYWWWQPQPLPGALIDFPIHFLLRRQSHFVYAEWPEQPWQENELQKPDFESALKRRSGNCIQSIRNFVNCGTLLIFVTEQLFKTLPRLFIGSSETVGMCCPPTVKYTSLRTFPLFRERLWDFAGLRAMRHQRSRSLSLCLMSKCLQYNAWWSEHQYSSQVNSFYLKNVRYQHTPT